MTSRWARLQLIAALVGSLASANVCLAEVETVGIRLETADVDGNRITAIELGDDFLLSAFVQDLRGSLAEGVFASYLDVTYPNTLVSLTGDIAYATPYNNGRTGNASVAGLVDDVGAFAGFERLGQEEYLLFTLPFNATALGHAVFLSDPADAVGTDVLVHGLNDAVPPEQVNFGSAALSIVAQDCVSANGSVAATCVCAAGDLAESGLLVGDLDGDGVVAFGDFLIVSENFGISPADYSTGDLNCSGTVDFADFLLLSHNFGETAVSGAAIPEPSSVFLFYLGVFVVAAACRRRGA